MRVGLKGMLCGQVGETFCPNLPQSFIRIINTRGLSGRSRKPKKIRKPDHLRTIDRLLHKQLLMQGRVGIARNLQAYEHCEVLTAWYLNITRVSLKKLTKIEGYFQQKIKLLSNLLTLNPPAD